MKLDRLSHSATVANLQAKVESLTTTNALMKEDLAIARNSLMALQAENAALRRASQHGHPIEDKTNVLDRFDPEMAETLAEERKKRQEIEKELDLQVSDSFRSWTMAKRMCASDHACLFSVRLFLFC